MSNSLQIEFINSPHGVYFPGQIVDGRVVLNSEETIKARFLKVCIHGSAETHWSESERRSRTNSEGKFENFTEHVKFASKIDYLNAETVVWTCADGSNKLPRGMHIFEFKFQLPIGLPPSFEGFHGHIRYSIHVELDRVWSWNKKTKKCFSVIPIFDLNQIPSAINPMVNTISKNMGLVFKKGLISMTVNLPKRGFVAGESIQILANIQNQTKLEIIQIRAKLMQLSTYQAARGHHFAKKHEDKQVAETRQQLHICGKAAQQLALNLRVPACVPSFTNCPILSVEYFLSVKIDVNKLMGSTLKCEFPIIIGTMPVVGPLATQVIPVAATQMVPGYPVAQEAAPSAPSAPPSYPSAPLPSAPEAYSQNPPSYEEATGNTVKGEDFGAFAPRYPVFNNLPLPTAPPMEKM
ncbi:unnamed protein product [Caenorhabditis angaria]|uniref:Arrestin C-terminal-like domain-containing protein n=1 Tax=Caenorhabditis angaria TaxID=860376 RepID=A0A9P1MUR7_9PELO|nr:unnamed protein product [Caenorhabditis angaria]